MKITIVMGSTGEYSDRIKWVVGAFISRAAAVQYCEAANQWCLENGVSMNGTRHNNRNYDHYDLKNPYDTQFRCDYTGTDYYLVEGIDLLDSLDPIDFPDNK